MVQCQIYTYNERRENANDDVIGFEKSQSEALEEGVEGKREEEQESTQRAVPIAQLLVVVVTMMMVSNRGT